MEQLCTLTRSLYDPYSTSYGKMIDSSGIRKKLSELVINRADSSYDICLGGYDDIVPVIITGKDREEESIPPFDLPIPFMVGGNRHCIGIDLREYVNSNIKKDSPVTYDGLMKCVSRHDNAKCLFMMGSVMAAVMHSDIGKIPKDEFIAAYTSLYNAVINGIVRLESTDDLACKVILGFWSYMMCTDLDISEINVAETSRIIVNKLKIASNSKTIDFCKDILFRASLQINNFAVEDRFTVNGLCKSFSGIYTEDVSKFFNPTLFINQLKGIWSGPGKSFAGIASMECLPVFIGVTYASMGITTYKSSRLTQILNKFSRVINNNEYIKKCERTFPHQYQN